MLETSSPGSDDRPGITVGGLNIFLVFAYLTLGKPSECELRARQIYIVLVYHSLCVLYIVIVMVQYIYKLFPFSAVMWLNYLRKRINHLSSRLGLTDGDKWEPRFRIIRPYSDS